jgi:hypothetical protein
MRALPQAPETSKTGLIPDFCSAACKQKAYMLRRSKGASGSQLERAFYLDMQHMLGGALFEREIVKVMQKYGLLPKNWGPAPVLPHGRN